MRQQTRLVRYFGSTAMAALIAAGLGGCQTTQSPDFTGSLGARGAASEIDTQRATEAYGDRYRANPRDPKAALQFGQALRANGQRQQAVAVLEQATIVNPGDTALMAAYGRALADNGNYQQAFDTLARAHTPSNPDWRILSVQGTALDQLGKHDEARRYYASALKIVPEEPTVLSNLGLSYVLSRDLPKAEATLRRATDRGATDPRVRQNLGLVVGLQGRFPEAESIVRADLPEAEAQANVAYLKQMLNRSANQRRGPQTSQVDGANRS